MANPQPHPPYRIARREFVPIRRLGYFCVGCLLLLAVISTAVTLLFDYHSTLQFFDDKDFYNFIQSIAMYTLTVGWLVGAVTYITCLLWCFRAFGNLRSFNRRFPMWVPPLATFMLAVPFVTLIAGFWYLSLLYRRSSPDDEVRSRSAWLVPFYVLVRVGLVNLIWWSLILPPTSRAIYNTLHDMSPDSVDRLFSGVIVLLIGITAWAAVTYVLRLNRMQEERDQQTQNVDYQECPQCGEFIPASLETCPVCGEEFEQPTEIVDFS